MNGITLAFLTAIISGVSIFANSYFVANTDPLVFTFLRNMSVALIFSGIILKSSKLLAEIKNLTRRKWIYLIAIGIIGGGIPFALFFIGLSVIGSVQANIINKSLFLWVAFMAVPILKEKLSWWSLFGYVIIFFSLFFGNNIQLSKFSLPVMFILIATFFWAVEHIIAKKALVTLSPALIIWGRMVFGLPILMSIIFIQSKSFASSQQSVMPIIVSTLFISVYMLTWYQALKKAPVTQVSLILVLAPFITMILEMVVKGKNLNLIVLPQSILLIVGLVTTLGFTEKFITQIKNRTNKNSAE